jgi:hypothetical protein
MKAQNNIVCFAGISQPIYGEHLGDIEVYMEKFEYEYEIVCPADINNKGEIGSIIGSKTTEGLNALIEIVKHLNPEAEVSWLMTSKEYPVYRDALTLEVVRPY